MEGFLLLMIGIPAIVIAFVILTATIVGEIKRERLYLLGNQLIREVRNESYREGENT